MDPTEQMQLMHEVLDGTASPEGMRDLERLLSTDPAARARFLDLERLFDCLKSMPKEPVPEGLTDAVMMRMPRKSTSVRGLRQLSWRRRVFTTSLNGDRGEPRTFGAGTRRVTRHGRSNGSQHMSDNDQKGSTSSKRMVWVGAGAAAIAFFLAGRYIEFPPKSDSTSGTIAPAVRYRADQPGASDVTVGGQSGTAQGVQQGAEAAGNDARSSDARNSDARSSDARSSDARSSDARSSDARSSDARNSDARSSDARNSENN